MNKILGLTKFLSLILIKQKATIFFVLLSLIIITGAFAFAKTNIGVEYKLFKDLILSTDSLFLHLISIFFTFILLEKFKQGSISILPLSLNIKRYEYIFSLFLTIIVSTFLIFISFIIIDLMTMYILKISFIAPLLLQVFLYYLSSILLSFVIITSFFIISEISLKAVTIGLLVFIAGNSLDELIYYYSHTNLTTMKEIINYVYYIFPNFSLFDIQTFVVNNVKKDYFLIGIQDLIYFLLISTILIIITVLKFRNNKVIPNDT